MQVTWEEFVTSHASAILAAATRVLGNSADAEEVTQEVFIEIFRANRVHEFHQQSALVRTMATRRAVDFLRRRKQHSSLERIDIAIPSVLPHERLVAEELGARLRTAILDLAPRESEVFCLVYFDERTHAEIAELLGISTGAVAKSLCKAREKLAIALQPIQSETDS